MALRRFLLAVAGAAAFSFAAHAAPPAAVSAYLPTTCQPGVAGDCRQSQPVTNPDGTNVGVGSSATPSVVKSQGGSSLATGQVSAGTTATLISAARAGRQSIIVTLGSAVACSFGNTGVTTANGFPLQAVAGATLTLDTSAAVYAVCASTATIGYVEVF